MASRRSPAADVRHDRLGERGRARGDRAVAVGRDGGADTPMDGKPTSFVAWPGASSPRAITNARSPRDRGDGIVPRAASGPRSCQ